jgi:hypothetical protein
MIKDQLYWEDRLRRWSANRPKDDEANQLSERLAYFLNKRVDRPHKGEVLHSLKWPEAKLDLARLYANKHRQDLLINVVGSRYHICLTLPDLGHRLRHALLSLDGSAGDQQKFVKQFFLRTGLADRYVDALIGGLDQVRWAVEKALDEADKGEEG